MPKNSEILNELMPISPLVAGIPPHQDLFGVPSGYFEGLPQAILEQIQAAGSVDSTLLQNIDKRPVFTVPGGYFDGFAASVLQLIKAGEAPSPVDELKALSPLLSGLEKKSPFTLPEGYFTELPENVISGVAALELVNDELENLSPLMNELKGQTAYSVPDGYFDRLPEALLHNVKEQAQLQARVISIGKSRKWIRYASAAVIAAVMVTAGSVFLNRPSSAGSDAITASISKLSDQEIQNFIDNQNTVVTDSVNTVTSADINVNDASDLLSDVPDEELEQYASNNVASQDDAMN